MTAAVRQQYEEAARVAGPWLDARGANATDTSPALELRDLLYASWYAAPRDVKDLAPLTVPLVGHLRAVHAGAHRWQSGWIAERVSTIGRIVAINGRDRRLLWPGDYALARGPARAPRPGDAVTIVDRIEAVEPNPGYWVTHSSDWFPQPPQMVRVYWNSVPRGAGSLVRRLTEDFAHLPHALKVPVDPAGFNRPDAVVLYLHAPMAIDTRARLTAAAVAERAWLATSTPPLTQAIGEGVGIAITPSHAEESFGQHRCRLIAEGLLTARSTASINIDAIAAVAARFTQDGLDPEHPWLAAP